MLKYQLTQRAEQQPQMHSRNPKEFQKEEMQQQLENSRPSAETGEPSVVYDYAYYINWIYVLSWLGASGYFCFLGLRRLYDTLVCTGWL